MDRQVQVSLLKRLLHYIETQTTAMAEAPWPNEVSTYTSASRLDREQEVLFRHHPLLMGFASEWDSPGAFRTDDFAGVPILVVRGQDGRLRAFLNVCRHRGTKVAQGSGTSRLLVCPYHAWSYELDGRLRGIPDERCFPGVRDQRPSLTPLPLCEKHGLVWVIPTAADDGIDDFNIDPWLAGLGPELGSYGFGSWSFFDRRVVPETFNWKLMVDTFHEVYHVGFLHKDSLKQVLHGNVADFEAFGRNHRMTIPRKKLEQLASQPEPGWDLMWNTALVYCLFPNTLLMVQGDHVELARIFPAEGRVDRAVMNLGLYVPKQPQSSEERTHWDKNMELILNVVTGEDFPASRTIQAGMASGAQTHIVYGRNEPALIHYHKSMRNALGLDSIHREAAE